MNRFIISIFLFVTLSCLISVGASRYLGWGRKPGMRYSKASSAFDLDNTFNKIYNKWEKRVPIDSDSPISNFRELRMRQGIPNAQVLLPHLFNRNNRGGAENNLEDLEMMYMAGQ